ncbi:MAG: hypoxanthine phosphoribosyltransferase [Planctomycetes bacterium]|jgi:hypoxanthine phosphoribosyltransferase|nr:hypoxanthine phosphoribosyltransferase [Planctomycetota bacterium]
MTEPDVERVLLSRERIETRVCELAGEIAAVYGDGEIVAVGVLTGAFVFLADLVRHLPNRVRFSFLKADSYATGTYPGALSVTLVGETDLSGRDVLVVEDILDTGRTLEGILGILRRRGPRTLRTVVLLDKVSRREVAISADFVGFPVPDAFLVGYGLDHAQRYRNLPYVGVLRSEAAGKSS